MFSYQTNLEGVTPDKLTGFFVGWPNPPSPETHLRILQASSHVVLAWEEDGAEDGVEDRVVGFVTAISDGVLAAYVPLLEVLPSHQKQGVGQELMRRMLESLDGLYMVDLLCDDALQPFYEKLGMRHSQGMMVRNYARQSGK